MIIHNGVLPSQFFRKLLANSLNAKNWNWREFPYPEKIEKSVQFYKNVIDSRIQFIRR